MSEARPLGIVTVEGQHAQRPATSKLQGSQLLSHCVVHTFRATLRVGARIYTRSMLVGMASRFARPAREFRYGVLIRRAHAQPAAVAFVPRNPTTRIPPPPPSAPGPFYGVVWSSVAGNAVLLGAALGLCYAGLRYTGVLDRISVPTFRGASGASAAPSSGDAASEPSSIVNYLNPGASSTAIPIGVAVANSSEKVATATAMPDRSTNQPATPPLGDVSAPGLVAQPSSAPAAKPADVNAAADTAVAAAPSVARTWWQWAWQINPAEASTPNPPEPAK